MSVVLIDNVLAIGRVNELKFELQLKKNSEWEEWESTQAFAFTLTSTGLTYLSLSLSKDQADVSE